MILLRFGGLLIHQFAIRLNTYGVGFKLQIYPWNHHPQNLEKLINDTREEWHGIDLEFIHQLILNMPERVEAVCKAKGAPTKY